MRETPTGLDGKVNQIRTKDEFVWNDEQSYRGLSCRTIALVRGAPKLCVCAVYLETETPSKEEAGRHGRLEMDGGRRFPRAKGWNRLKAEAPGIVGGRRRPASPRCHFPSTPLAAAQATSRTRTLRLGGSNSRAADLPEHRGFGIQDEVWAGSRNRTSPSAGTGAHELAELQEVEARSQSLPKLDL